MRGTIAFVLLTYTLAVDAHFYGYNNPYYQTPNYAYQTSRPVIPLFCSPYQYGYPTPGQQSPPPVAQAPAVQAPVAQAPAVQAPVTQAPAVQAPVDQAPAVQALVDQAPPAQAPAEQEQKDPENADLPQDLKRRYITTFSPREYYSNPVQTQLVRELVQPQHVREFVQPQQVRELVQPQQVREFVQPQQVREFVQPQQVREFVQPQQVRELAHPQQVREFVQPQQVRQLSSIPQPIQSKLFPVQSQQQYARQFLQPSTLQQRQVKSSSPVPLQAVLARQFVQPLLAASYPSLQQNSVSYDTSLDSDNFANPANDEYENADEIYDPSNISFDECNPDSEFYSNDQIYFM